MLPFPVDSITLSGQRCRSGAQIEWETYPLSGRERLRSSGARVEQRRCRELTLPMQIRKVVARSEVKADRDRYAERGVVYCVEGADDPFYRRLELHGV